MLSIVADFETLKPCYNSHCIFASSRVHSEILGENNSVNAKISADVFAEFKEIVPIGAGL